MTKEKVYKFVSQIPKGKVATYGQIARLADTGSRAVGQLLHQNTDPENIPCHRVVHSDGSLALGYAFGGGGKQRELLNKEGIEFIHSKINLKQFGWVL